VTVRRHPKAFTTKILTFLILITWMYTTKARVRIRIPSTVISRAVDPDSVIRIRIQGIEDQKREKKKIQQKIF
jgi:hypothetical protein